MDLRNHQEFKELLSNIFESMMEWVEDEGFSYKKKDVRKCILIIDQFLDKISEAENKAAGFLVIKSTVEQLNILNKSFKSGLIGTMEREDLCEIINTASMLKGYSTKGEDVTEDFRDW